MTKTNLKTNYGIDHLVESFFTGQQLVFTQDGKHFYCAHRSVINKVDIGDGQVKAQIKASNEEDTVINFTVTSDDSMIIIAYQSNLLKKFNLSDETIEREFKSIHTAPITQLRINPSNTLLATGSSDGTIKLWNLINHYCSHNLKGVNGVITCILFQETLDKNLIYCSAGDECIHVFDLDTSTKVAKLSTHCSTITDMKLNQNNTRLVSVGRDKIAVIWDISDHDAFGRPLRTIPIFESIESVVIVEPELLNSLINVAPVADRVIFATVGEAGTIKFWDSITGSNILSQNEPSLSQDRSPSSACLQICLRPKQNQLCVVSAERDVFVYELPRLDLVQQLQGHLDEIFSACWFANDKYLAVACNSNDLKVINAKTSKFQHLKGHTDIVLCVKSFPSHPFLLVSSSKDCFIIVWRFCEKTMKPSIVYKGSGHTHSIHAISVSIVEKVFFSGGEDTTLKRWCFDDIETDQEICDDAESLVATKTIKAHESRIDDIAVSPNDQLIATGSRDKTAKIFSADSLHLIATLKGHKRGVYAVRFSPVDQVIVTAADVNLRMWNLQDFTCVKTFQGHDCAILNFSFLSSGMQMLSIGSDGNMKLWDCKTNECVKTIDAHSGNTWVLAMSDNDSEVVTGGQDERLVLWRDITDEERQDRLVNLQTQVIQEQDFINYINKKKWRKALMMAIKMENQTKTLNVMREIVLEPDGVAQLADIVDRCSLDHIEFIVGCCLTWTATAKNCTVGQQVLNVIIRRVKTDQLMKLPSLKSSIEHLKTLTEKNFSRYERLVQQATFVDFFAKSLRIQ